MATIFTKIIEGEIPSHKISENEYCFAFLDINPLVLGHVLVVPKVEVDYIFDLEDSILTELNVFAKTIAIALKKAIPCVRIGTAVIGLEVPHTHIHLIPLQTMDDINFTRKKLSPTQSELEDVAQRIKKELAI